MARWEQRATLGTSFSVPFADLTFTASGAMTWTVTSANMPFFRIDKLGRVAVISFRFINTTIGGVADAALNVTLPASMIGVFATTAGLAGFGTILLGGTSGNVIGSAVPGSANRVISFRMPLLANWALSAGAQNISGCLTAPLG